MLFGVALAESVKSVAEFGCKHTICLRAWQEKHIVQCNADAVDFDILLIETRICTTVPKFRSGIWDAKGFLPHRKSICTGIRQPNSSLPLDGAELKIDDNCELTVGSFRSIRGAVLTLRLNVKATDHHNSNFCSRAHGEESSGFGISLL